MIVPSVIGVTPTDTESRKTGAPAGVDETDSVPVRGGICSGTAPDGVPPAGVWFPEDAGAGGEMTVIVVRNVVFTDGLETVTS